MRLSILFLILSVSLSGCLVTQVEDYPKEWPALEAQVPGQCPDLNGSFSDAGICVPKGGEGFWGGLSCSSLSLANFDFLRQDAVNGVHRTKYPDDVFVELSQPDPGKLDVVVRIKKSGLLVDRRIFNLNPASPKNRAASPVFYSRIL
jgi:hypothetical protein